MMLDMPLNRAMELLPGIWQRHLGHRVYYACLKMRGLYCHPDSFPCFHKGPEEDYERAYAQVHASPCARGGI